ncbi:MAG: hypothetical protein HZB92_05630 [Euryarchaeota archaeon]|nr:hypothetical protein [Euryarchaeota archaeon]
MRIRFMKIDPQGPILHFKDGREKSDIAFCMIGWESLRTKPRRCERKRGGG